VKFSAVIGPPIVFFYSPCYETAKSKKTQQKIEQKHGGREKTTEEKTPTFFYDEPGCLFWGGNLFFVFLNS
jgi:hypothetical protein